MYCFWGFRGLVVVMWLVYTSVLMVVMYTSVLGLLSVCRQQYHSFVLILLAYLRLGTCV